MADPNENDTQPNENDPWSEPDDTQPEEPEVGSDSSEAPFEPHPDAMVTVTSPEGQEMQVKASEVKQYEELDFTASVNPDNLSADGSLTVEADDHWVEFGKAEREQALRRLNR